jgi:uncharacterized protein (TIGR03437 family)
VTGKHKISAGIAGLLFTAAAIYAHKDGPDPRRTGAPGDETCVAADCHVGTDLNAGGGNVVVNFENGQVYKPGVAQTFTIVITDSQARDWGFQMTARLESNPATAQAGDFTAGKQQLVICENSLFKTSKGCPADAPVQFIEHSTPLSSNTISVKWTPPAANAGNVHIYVAANAGNGNLEPTGDHIYTADYVLTPECTNVTPTISVVQSAGAFDPKAGLASGTWLEIYGSDLSCLSRGWAGSDFDGSKAPTSLSTVGVTVGGVAAFVDYVSPGQVNVQAPDDPKNGAGFQVVLTNSAGASNAFIMQKNAVAPALLSPPVFNTQGHQWVVAQHLDQTFVGKANLISGLSFSPAKRGELITIYGIGFGPVIPATLAGVVASTQNSLQSKPNIRFGQTPATLQYYGLVPGYVGLYQFNVVVPSTVSPGDMQLSVDAGGVTLAPSLFITVAQ